MLALSPNCRSQRARNDDGAARPGHVVGINRPVGGRDVGDDAVGSLRIGHVLQPLCVKRRDVEEIRFALAFLRTVAEPALPLIALRTISRYAMVISARAPDDVRVNAVDQLIRAKEISGDGQIIVHDAAFDGIQVRLAGKTRDFDVTEPVRDKTRLPSFRAAAAAQRVNVRDFRAAQVRQVKRAVRLQSFRVAQGDLRSRRAGNMQPAPADHVLAQVVNENARLGFLHRNRLERSGHADGFLHLRGNSSARRGDNLRRLPAGPFRGVKAGAAPAGHFAARIIFLAVVIVVRADRAVGRQFPRFVADNFRT